MAAHLIPRLIALLRLHRDCTCAERNTAIWGHLDDCPQRHWYHRGYRIRITGLIPLPEFSHLVQQAAGRRACTDQPPGLAADDIARRVINDLNDRHLI